MKKPNFAFRVPRLASIQPTQSHCLSLASGFSSIFLSVTTYTMRSYTTMTEEKTEGSALPTKGGSVLGCQAQCFFDVLIHIALTFAGC